ncbi:hypothetical protein Tco_1193600 [Tanacetum coccineum]
MSSNSDDLQAVGSDSCPPMLDRTDYESWSQRIQLYCRGKENGLLILQSIDQGPFELRNQRYTLGLYPEGRCSKLTKKLVNDMRNIRMTMPNIQLNSKFMNNMSPEWDRKWGAQSIELGNAMQDEHEIHNEVQQANVIDSTSVDMGNSNVIPYEQYLSIDNISVVPSCASFALNDVCVSSDNDAFVPRDLIATELKIYKEQVAIYEQRAKFELTKQLLKTHYVPVIVPSSEEDLELAETTRNKLHAKMNDFACVEKRNKDLTAKLNALHDLNDRFRAENAKVKQHYKELYDSIKITHAKTTDQNNSLLSKIENLKAQLKDNSKCVTIPDSKPKVLAPSRYPINVEPIPPRHKNNQEVHLHYIKHLKEM